MRIALARLSALLLLLLTVLTSISPALAERITLSGEVTYRERLALPPDARLRVKLVDLSLATPLPRVQAEAAIASPGQVPLSFALSFEDRIVMPGSSYGLVAEIFTADRLYFANTEPFVLDPLAPPETIAFVLTYLAQAATPVEAEPVPDPVNPITEITWRAVTLRGEPVPANPASTLSIANDMRAGGRGGCNSYFAQAQMAGNTLVFSEVAATRMACVGAAGEQEATFFGVLADTRRFRREGDTLVLLDGANGELATLTPLRPVMHTPELIGRLLDVIETDIAPMTRREVARGNKIFGAAILLKSDLSLVIAETNNEVENPLWHGEMHAIKKLYERPRDSLPAPRDCIFLATHEPCSLCLSAITWAGYDSFYYLFSHEQSRDDFNIPHDLRILKEVFTLEPGGYNATNAYWTSHDINRLVASLDRGSRENLVARIDDIGALYADLSAAYQAHKGAAGIPLD